MKEKWIRFIDEAQAASRRGIDQLLNQLKKNDRLLSTVRKASHTLDEWSRPNDSILITALIQRISQIMLLREESAYLNGVKIPNEKVQGMFGAVKVTGNGAPVFSYLMFDKQLMEFVRVSVELSLPDRIAFSYKIDSEDEATHGKEVEEKEEYKAPFYKLAYALYDYFPIHRHSSVNWSFDELRGKHV